MHVFTRYIATYIVVPGGLVAAYALGTATNAQAATVHSDYRPSIVATPTVTAHPAPNEGHSSHHGAGHLAQLQVDFPH
jgi:hypothetical protein